MKVTTNFIKFHDQFGLKKKQSIFFLMPVLRELTLMQI